MRLTLATLALAMGLLTSVAVAQDRSPAAPPRAKPRSGQEPPPQAYEDCRGKKAGETVQHATREGTLAATCMESPNGLVARPNQRSESRAKGSEERPAEGNAPQGHAPRDTGRRYSLDQAVSDRAQLNTIAFDGLAFLTGDFGYDTFLPPGKVSDYFGFQYMRDIDAQEGGHNTSFLTRIAHNMLTILNDEQPPYNLTKLRY